MKFPDISGVFSGLGKSKGKEAVVKDTSRQMKFPYTFTAKIAQFPLKYHIEKNWLWKYTIVGVVVSLPIFYKIHRMANSPANVEKWRLIKEKERAADAEGHH